MHIAKADIAKDPGEFSTVSPRNWIDLKKLGRERSQPIYFLWSKQIFRGQRTNWRRVICLHYNAYRKMKAVKNELAELNQRNRCSDYG